MLFFPNAKINIGLNITEKRDDGFHNLQTIFYPIPLYDIIEFIESQSSDTEFINTGIKVDSNYENNLIIKAYNLLKIDFDLPPLKIHLHKIIPMGAGLGGGSSDASFMLKYLNIFFNLELSDNQLESYALKLGSDCPFFIKNKPVYAHGTGNIFKKIDMDLSKYYLLLVKPDVYVGTQQAYSQIIPKFPKKNLQETIKESLGMWKNSIFNDFEVSVFKLFPEIQETKDEMYKLGAIYSSMSGSGASVFGIFEEKPRISKLFQKYFYFLSHLE